MTDTNPAKFKKLVTLLRELFQLDQPDLDFGIYRINDIGQVVQHAQHRRQGHMPLISRGIWRTSFRTSVRTAT